MLKLVIQTTNVVAGLFLSLDAQMQQYYSKMDLYFRICFTSLQTSDSIPASSGSLKTI